MDNKIKLEIVVKEETLNEIDKLLGYYQTLMLFEDKDLPTNYEEFIKSAIDYYLIRLESIHSFTIGEKIFKLNSDKKLKNRLKLFVEELGLKQKDLSDATGIDPGALSNILSNRNQPSIDYFLRIWIALGCPPIDELFYRQ